MNRSLSISLIALPLSFAAAGGCQTGVNAPHYTRADSYDMGHITLSGKHGDDLRRQTAFAQEHVDRDQYGLLVVTIPLRSAVDHTLYLEYQYTFFDANGGVVEGPMGWTPITLEAASPGTIVFHSTQPTAAEFHVNIRYLR